MKIIVNPDVMLARRKMRLKGLAKAVELTEQNLSMIKTLRLRAFGLRHWPKSALFWIANRAIFWSSIQNVSPKDWHLSQL